MPDTLRRQIAGASAIERALAAGQPVRAVFVATGSTPDLREGDLLQRAERSGAAVREIGARAFARFRADPRELRMIALVGPPPDAALGAVLAAPEAVWLLVDSSYPGNAGFVIRTAEVSGAGGVVIDADFDRIARRDAIRSSLRADRLMPVFFEPAEVAVTAAVSAGRRVVAIEDGGTRAPWEVDLTGNPLLVAGGEGTGIPTAILESADEIVRIPMPGFIPSYNLQAAVAAVAVERLRQVATR